MAGMLVLGIGVSLAAQTNTPVDKPWRVTGTVTDVKGGPVTGATVYAHCGIGSLFPTGQAVSGTNGAYDLWFGPGVRSSTKGLVQAATISVHLAGWFETNLHRQGDLIAGMELPAEAIHWGNKTTNDLFLPGVPRRLDFVLAPAAVVKGSVTDASGKPLAGKRVGLTGEILPPSCSVIAETRSDDKGAFEFQNVPIGYAFRLYAEDGRRDWRRWPWIDVNLLESGTYEYRLKVQGDQLAK
jgi:hypothetical protein